jgi:tetratricopeptide (TPR) repeat protein
MKKVSSFALLAFGATHVLFHSCSSRTSEKPLPEVQALVDSSKAWLRKDQDTALYYAEEAIKLSESMGDEAGQDRAVVLPLVIYTNRWEEPLIAESLAKAMIVEGQVLGREYRVSRGKSALGSIQQYKENYIEAILLQEEALEMERIAQRGESILGDLINLGTTYGYFGDYNKEIECYYEALKICDSLGFERYRPRLLANLSACNYDLGNLDIAEQFLHESITVRKKTGNSAMADSFSNLAKICRERNEYEEALRYIKSSDSIAMIIGDSGCLYRNRLSEANVMIGMGHGQAGLDLILSTNEWPGGALDTLHHYFKVQLLAFGYYETGQLDSSEKYVRLYESYCRRVGSPRMAQANYETFANFYQSAGNNEKALVYYFLADKLGDSIANYQSRQNAILEEGRYKRLKAEKKIVEAEKEAERSKAIGIGTGLVLFGGLGLYFIRYRGQKKLGKLKDQQIERSKLRIERLNRSLEEKEISLEQKTNEIDAILEQMEEMRASGNNIAAVNDLEQIVAREQKVKADLEKDLDILEDSISDLEKDIPISFRNLAYEDAGIYFREIICARSKGHEFLMIHLDSTGIAKETKITRAWSHQGPVRISKLIQESNRTLLGPNRGYAINPAFVELSADGKRVIIKHEQSLELIRKNIASKNPKFRFFEEETIPIASGRSTKKEKDFEEEYNEWKVRSRRITNSLKP